MSPDFLILTLEFADYFHVSHFHDHARLLTLTIIFLVPQKSPVVVFIEMVLDLENNCVEN